MTDFSMSTWLANRVQRALRKDVMTPSERTGDIVGIGVMLILTLFFVYHQVTNTGFFTARFGTLETILFYGVVPFTFLISGGRTFLGRRNPLRPLEALNGVWWTVTSLWLLVVFPFDFAHFGDPLGPLGFLLSWIPNVLVQLLLGVGAVLGVANVLYTVDLYWRVKRGLAGGVPAPAAS